MGKALYSYLARRRTLSNYLELRNLPNTTMRKSLEPEHFEHKVQTDVNDNSCTYYDHYKFQRNR